MKIEKTFNGLVVASEFALPLQGDDGQAYLSIRTDKGGTFASVIYRKDDSGSYSTVLFQDYMKSKGAKVARATEKALIAAHQVVLGGLEQIRAEALAHYNIVEA
jgi:hypothetical protein